MGRRGSLTVKRFRQAGQVIIRPAGAPGAWAAGCIRGWPYRPAGVRGAMAGWRAGARGRGAGGW